MPLRGTLIVFAVATCLMSFAAGDTALGSGFTYQGQLRQAGAPVNGPANFVFRLYDAATAGNLLGTQTLNGATVTSGLFTVQLNGAAEFGAGVFDGHERWLDITVNGIALAPRQKLNAAPYALFAAAPWVTNGTDISYPAGRVSIGTSSPSAALYVQGSATASSGAVYGLQSSGDTSSGGIYGKSNVVNGNGVIGEANGSGAYGLWGKTDSGFAVRGSSTSGYGGYFEGKGYFSGNVGIGSAPAAPLDVVGPGASNSGTLHVVQTVGLTDSAAIWGHTNVAGGNGVVGEAFGQFAFAVSGYADAGTGVYGRSTSGTGVSGSSNTANGVEGSAPVSAFAVYAFGRLGASGTKSMRIDHPLDPENKYLLHYCAEGPEPMNTYSGRARLDANGEAWVALPEYFGEINRDPRIQLTAFGAAMPDLHVGSDVQDNAFQIAGGAPQGEVFWRVEAVRNDAWMRAYGAPVEMEKAPAERGRYQNPELYGQPEEKGIRVQLQAEAAREIGAAAPVAPYK